MKMLCSVQLSKHRYKTPEGYLVCKDCIIARTGKQTYLKSELFGMSEGGDEYIDVDRKASEVFDEKTLASFEGKPLTIEHPNENVTPENYKELSVGNVHNVRRGNFEGQDVMFADINVYDANAIELIESGEMEELSCGYDCDITDGPNPEQINIRGNHVALCEQGRAGIARIQDSKSKIDPRIHPLIVYQYHTDKANELDMSEFINRLIMEYLPNDLSRQLTKEEKEYVKQEAKKIMSDSWGVKPVVKDEPLGKDLSGIPTVELSFRMPEEAGRDKRLHYMPGIRNCVALAEELDKKASSLGVSKMKTKTTEAPFSEGDRKDSWWEMSNKHGWSISREWDSSAKPGEFNEYYVFTKIGDKAKVGDSVQKGTLIQEFGRYADQYKIVKIQGNVLYCEELSTGKTFLFKKDKENVDWAVITKSEVKDSKIEEKDTSILRSEEKHYTVTLFSNYVTSMPDRVHTFVSYVMDPEIKDYVWDNKEEAFEAAKEALSKHPPEIKEPRGYEYHSALVTEWQSGDGHSINEKGEDIGSMNSLTNANPEDYPPLLKKALGSVNDSDPKRYMVYHYSSAAERNVLDGDGLSLEEGKKMFEEVVEKLSQNNKRREHAPWFNVSLEEESDFYGDKEQIRFAEIDAEGNVHESDKAKSLDSFAMLHSPFAGTYKRYIYHYDRRHPSSVHIYKDGRLIEELDIKSLMERGDAEELVKKEIDALDYAAYEAKIHPSGKTPFWLDSYAIALPEGDWLDENDRPTKDEAYAKRFKSAEDADAYRKIYCKGEVKLIKDSSTLSEEAGKIEKMLSDIEHGKIYYDPDVDVIDISFEDRSKLRKAAKRLNEIYETEINDEDEKDMWLSVYSRLEKKTQASDSSVFRIRKGAPSDRLKAFLDEKGIEAKIEDADSFVRFEVKDNAEVIEEIKAINADCQSAKGYDEYSKRFYAKAIDILKEKLAKLERNELLDSNQGDYEKQKEKVAEEIKAQIEEYSKKINALG